MKEEEVHDIEEPEVEPADANNNQVIGFPVIPEVFYLPNAIY